MVVDYNAGVVLLHCCGMLGQKVMIIYLDYE